MRKILPLFLELFKKDVLAWGIIILSSATLALLLKVINLIENVENLEFAYLLFYTLSAIVFTFFFRPWIKIYNYVNLLPLEKVEKIFLIAMTNISSYIIGIASLIIACNIMDNSADSVTRELELSPVVIIYSISAILCATFSFAPYDPGRNKTFFGIRGLKWLIIICLAFALASLVLPSYLFVHSFFAICSAGYIWGSLFEAKIVKLTKETIFSCLVFFTFFLLFIPRPSVKDLVSAKEPFRFSSFLNKVEELSVEDKKLAYFWILRSDLNSYEFEKTCRDAYPNRGRRQESTYFEQFNCLIPMPSLSDFKTLLFSKSRVMTATEVFASFDIQEIGIEHIFVFTEYLHFRDKKGDLSKSKRDIAWDSFYTYLDKRAWSEKEMKSMLEHSNAGVNLIGLKLIIEHDKLSLLAQEVLNRIKSASNQPFFNDLANHTSLKYLCQRDFVFNLYDFNKQYKECNIYASAFGVVMIDELYLGNSYRHALKVLVQ